ncbi:general stress protein [Halalkalibacillus sediminis]|uniref:General stress protein n=1 Tax=Halalkalibacillus sediminis TaxID=2018042 RepID=A0A2I0QRC7_9BACI|nr:general stress protein [Halalkalibacillus sediminis]PKR76886.1 general stress protein [Halalkalibacillus sediminis]
MPFIREYTNDEKLVEDIKKLSENGVRRDDVYVLSHDDDRTKRIANNAGANTIGFSEQDLKNAVGNMFAKKGDELRSKLQEIGFSEAESENYEEDMDEGKVLLIVTGNDNIESYLA